MAQAIAMTLMAGGTGLSAYSTYQQGEEANKMGKIQQLQYNAEAKAVEMSGQDEARLQREAGQRLLSTQIANVSAGGGQISGSNLYVIADSARNVEIDALVIERNYKTNATSLRQQGALARYEGQMARRNARIATVAGLLSGGGQMAGMYKQAKPTPAAATTTNTTGVKAVRPSNYSSMYNNREGMY